MTAAGARLRLYYRHGCHLCEDMLRDLAALDDELGIEVDVVDIDRDAELRDRYHTRVPVLAGGGEELCQYFLDPAAVRQWVAAGRR
ncbi:MAG: glutaredoxin family protein [Chromatiales bacterium]|jgi:hypothetical protein